MSFLSNLFGSKEKKEQRSEKGNGLTFLMPINGEIIDRTDIPDPVFAEGMMGDGFGIVPLDGKVYAPADGEVVSIFPTKHAIGMKMENGIEYLIHFGLETVNLKGEGFTSHITDGQKIKSGDLILEVDLESIKTKVPSIITPVIFTDIKGHTFSVNKGNSSALDNSCITIK